MKTQLTRWAKIDIIFIILLFCIFYIYMCLYH